MTHFCSCPHVEYTPMVLQLGERKPVFLPVPISFLLQIVIELQRVPVLAVVMSSGAQFVHAFRNWKT